MRRYIARLEKMGELNPIEEEIHWHLQAAALGVEGAAPLVLVPRPTEHRR